MCDRWGIYEISFELSRNFSADFFYVFPACFQGYLSPIGMLRFFIWGMKA